MLEDVLPNGSIDATGLPAGSNTLVEVNPSALVVADPLARGVVTHAVAIAKGIDGGDDAIRGVINR